MQNTRGGSRRSNHVTILCPFFWEGKGPPFLKDKWLCISKWTSQMPPGKGSKVDLGGRQEHP